LAVRIVARRPVAGQRERDKHENKDVYRAKTGKSNSVFCAVRAEIWSNEPVVRQSPSGKNASTKQKTLLRSVTRQRLVKIQQTEKTLCVL
jgi:hypothetical protein